MRLLAAFTVAVLLSAACGAGQSTSADPSTTSPSDTSPTTTSPRAQSSTTATSPSTTQPVVSTTAVAKPRYEIISTLGIEYVDFALLDIHGPSQPGPWPIVVVVHGIFQGRSVMSPLAQAIAGQGAVVYNVSVTMSPPYLTAIDQIACAVRFARSTAPDHGATDDRVTLVGNSSGAHTGAIVALGAGTSDADCAVKDETARIDAFVGYEGPYDHASKAYGDIDLRPLESTEPETWATVNTFSHIGGNPGLVVHLVHGRDVDTQWYDVLPDTTEALHTALIAAGYKASLTYVEGAAHAGLLSETAAFQLVVAATLDLASGQP